jgi:signal transduction histidine kinase
MDRAETRVVDLNELLSDVAALLRAGDIRVELELLPFACSGLSCHPQPLSAAITSIVAFTLEACAEAGAKKVTLFAVEGKGCIEVRAAYHGEAPPKERLDRLLEPMFEVAGARVAARTWSLFSARQVVRAEGGEVRAFSEPGGETGFAVTLPVPDE